MSGLSVTVSTKAASNLLRTVAKQVPFAAAAAANDLARQVREAERLAMPQVFKHPRPFTANSVFTARATKASPIATVFIRPEVAKYLKPCETGGLHVLPGKGLLNPKDIGLDQYGQLPRQAAARLKSRQDVFVGTVKTKDGKSIRGFWQRLDVTRSGKVRRKRRGQGTIYSAEHGALKLLLRFGEALPVRKHLDFKARAAKVIAINAGPVFARAMAKALASAR